MRRRHPQNRTQTRKLGHTTDARSQPCDTHHVTRHTEKRKPCQETATWRHDAEHAMISNATQQQFCEAQVDLTLKNTSRHKDDVGAMWRNLFARSCPSRQLPVTNTIRSSPRNNRIRREAACGPTRPHHTPQKNMFSRATNFNCHDMLRTSLSSDTQTPLVSSTTDYAWPTPTAPPLPRQRGNTSSAAHEFASERESNVEPRSLLSQLAWNDL